MSKHSETQDLNIDGAAQTATAPEIEVVTPDVAPDASETTEALPLSPEAEVEQLQLEVTRLTDQVQRTAAEFQNYRRRTEQEKRQLAAFTKGMVVEQLLDVWDDFQRTMTELEKPHEDAATAFASLKKGFELVYQKFNGEMEKLGVTAIEAEGQPFNEAEHEALMQQSAPEGVEPGTVLQELQPGYRMGDRVLRHTRVIVAAE